MGLVNADPLRVKAMAYPAHFPRPFVIRLQRETVALVIGAVALTFALSNTIHGRRDLADRQPAGAGSRSIEQDWAGDLADRSSIERATPSAPFTSASLVVPASQLALPRMPVRALVKLHGCDAPDCGAKGSAPLPQRRPATARGQDTPDGNLTMAELAPVRSLLKPEAPRIRTELKPSLMSRMNPLNHLPDASTIKRPFAYAGDTVTGWFKRF